MASRFKELDLRAPGWRSGIRKKLLKICWILLLMQTRQLPSPRYRFWVIIESVQNGFFTQYIGNLLYISLHQHISMEYYEDARQVFNFT